MSKLQKAIDMIVNLPDEEFENSEVIILQSDLIDEVINMNVHVLGAQHGAVRSFITEVLSQDEAFAKEIYTEIAMRKVKGMGEA